MGRLRDFFDRGADEDISSFTSPLLLPGMYEYCSTPTLDWEWSMVRYEDELSDRIRRDDSQVKEAWDELERSVVAKAADDVKASIRGRQVETTIIKKLAA